MSCSVLSVPRLAVVYDCKTLSLRRTVHVGRFEWVAWHGGDVMRPRAKPANLCAFDVEGGPSALTDDDQLLFTLGYYTDFPLLILGETGVGKSHLARLIHEGSSRRAAPFVVADCGVMTESLFEAELFGHRKGAFTGAVHSSDGLVTRAEGGTLFLDEIGNLPRASQTKLLRLIEAKVFRTVGDSTERAANVRIIAATNLDVERAMRQGSMREDLYYRLTTVEPVRVRPLRERRGAIPVLAEAFVCARAAAGKVDVTIDKGALGWAACQSWPGNVRQLKGAIEVAFELAAVRRLGCEREGAHNILVQDLVRAAGARASEASHHSPEVSEESEPVSSGHLRDPESANERPQPNDPSHREWVVALIQRAGRNQSRAANLAGVSRRTMINWIERYGLPRPRVEVHGALEAAECEVPQAGDTARPPLRSGR